MVTTETHQSQDLLVPPQIQEQLEQLEQLEQQEENQASPSSPLAGFDPETMSQGPVNAITVLTLLDKLVNMLDAVQENQNKMEVSQGWGHTSTSGLSVSSTDTSTGTSTGPSTGTSTGTTGYGISA